MSDEKNLGEPVLDEHAPSRYVLERRYQPSNYLGRVDDWDVWQWAGAPHQGSIVLLIATNGKESRNTGTMPIKDLEDLEIKSRHAATRWIRAACAFLVQHEGRRRFFSGEKVEGRGR